MLLRDNAQVSASGLRYRGTAMDGIGSMINLAAWAGLILALIWLAHLVLPDNDSSF